ncbi:DUF1134 domain-containing protein [Parvularcula sp. LCG005]|uniref:DUF1134 domain-containing protein n=1 Tax=Parvularcula sp. LCG005 TaxID=3078805 RepID=UPI0029431510|nr:DUF1134 domain-containing protein [Parvularcula sp. LCG005]WOI53526.1 DUF1134 domain-containing protein [Parvularcula sp. LCG005]
MNRIATVLLTAALSALPLSGCISPRTSAETSPPPPPPSDGDFTQSGVVSAVEDWLGVSAETAGTLVQRTFADLGEPNGYIYGEEASGAIGPGLRYGHGTLVMRNGYSQPVYWQGPSIGWDVGANASKTFTLVYDIPHPDEIYRRFPGVEGTAYLVGGVGVNYQRAENITLVPMRAGVGARLGANVGYLAYSRDPRVWPF